MSQEADPIDQAADMQLQIEEAAISIVRKAANIPIPKSEYCLNCGEATLNGARWCDASCRDIWAAR